MIEELNNILNSNISLIEEMNLENGQKYIDIFNKSHDKFIEIYSKNKSNPSTALTLFREFYRENNKLINDSIVSDIYSSFYNEYMNFFDDKFIDVKFIADFNNNINENDLEAIKKAYKLHPNLGRGLEIASNEYHRLVDMCRFLSPLQTIECRDSCLKKILGRQLNADDKEIIKILINDGVNDHILKDIIRKGIFNTGEMEQLVGNKEQLIKEIAFKAVEKKDVDGLNRLFDKYPLLREEADNFLNLAIPTGDVEFVKFILTLNPKIDDDQLIMSAGMGLNDIFDLIAPNNLTSGQLSECLIEASAYGHLTLTQNLCKRMNDFSHKFDKVKTIINNCVKDSHKELFEWVMLEELHIKL